MERLVSFLIAILAVSTRANARITEEGRAHMQDNAERRSAKQAEHQKEAKRRVALVGVDSIKARRLRLIPYLNRRDR